MVLQKQELCGCNDGLVKQEYYCGADFADGLVALVMIFLLGCLLV